MPRYADIALPVSVSKIFTYLVPSELDASACVGVRAIVPFGRTLSTGLIVGLPDSTTITSLKPLRDIIDPEPVVTDPLLQLCRWISDYYMAPLGEVLRTAVPHGFSSSSVRVVHLAHPIPAGSIDALRRQAPQRAAILSLLAAREQMRSTDLQRATGIRSINSHLNSLVREGFITTEEVLPRAAGRPAIIEFVNLAATDPAALVQEIERTPVRFTQSRRLLDGLRKLRAAGTAEIAAPDFLRQVAGSARTLRKLAAAGIIALTRREVRSRQDPGTDNTSLSLTLNSDQRASLSAVVSAIDSGGHSTMLLHGVTGSGKTQVYIEAIRHCLERGKSAIVLVPEIGLTPQIVRRFRSHFGDIVAVVHSRMSPRERLAVWRRSLAGECRIVIGPRSAVFVPVPGPGLIVVDEEHDASYKQFDANPRYHARDVAIVRGSLEHATVLLGSATPSVESFFNAGQGKYRLLSMPFRIDRVPMPDTRIVDMNAERKQEYASVRASLPQERRGELKRFSQSPISSVLKEKIADRLSRGEGIIVLQNRRGFAPFVECSDCGYVESCENCSVTMTYHLAKRHLRCHYCGSVRAPHSTCPQCGSSSLMLHGIGTQRVEEKLGALFPAARILRMDLDTTTRKGSHDRILSAFGSGKADILLGTQMVAKGLDFPRVTLVGVISADTQLLLPDFRASERTFQLLTQVAGRAGRSTLRGEVIIQTQQPEHSVFRHVVGNDYGEFYNEEVASREEPGYPPFVRLALVEFRGKNDDKVKAEAERFLEALRPSSEGLLILGPSPAVISRVRNEYRWHVLIKSPRKDDASSNRLRQALRHVLERANGRSPSDVRTIVDIDPVGML